MTRDEIISAIRGAAAALSTNRLSIPMFHKQTGVAQSAVLRHFDSWSDACDAAGVSCGPTRENLVPRRRVSKEECIKEMQRVANLIGQNQLSTTEFNRLAQFTSKPVISRFGSWQKALDTAGLAACEKAKLDKPLSVEECVNELCRVARMLSTRTLTQRVFDEHARFSSYRVVRACDGWLSALTAAGLDPSPNFMRTIPLAELANEFLKVVRELKCIPTLIQLSNRCSHAADTYSRNRGGYGAFKVEAIRHLLSADRRMRADIRRVLENELVRLVDEPASAEQAAAPRHRQGRTLNFRGFIYAPTNESDVVALFGAVAHDLGFEILANRSAFPDCEARRRVSARREHFVDCMIEYEFSSMDFKRHGHPASGCDLIVCWQHNWPDCPLEVLDLSEETKSLDGWQ